MLSRLTLCVSKQPHTGLKCQEVAAVRLEFSQNSDVLPFEDPLAPSGVVYLGHAVPRSIVEPIFAHTLLHLESDPDVLNGS